MEASRTTHERCVAFLGPLIRHFFFVFSPHSCFKNGFDSFKSTLRSCSFLEARSFNNVFVFFFQPTNCISFGISTFPKSNGPHPSKLFFCKMKDKNALKRCFFLLFYGNPRLHSVFFLLRTLYPPPGVSHVWPQITLVDFTVCVRENVCVCASVRECG